MGERKVLNRYFPPDFDPLLVPKRKYDPYKQVEVRMMIPFSLQCIKCGEYMYRGKKFNSRKEDVIGDDYLGIKKYRFYIKCCVCNNEIAFKTDPKNQDYVCESGATRNFESWRQQDEAEEKFEGERKEAAEANAMSALESKTLDSKIEMDILDALDEIKAYNERHERVDRAELGSAQKPADEMSAKERDEMAAFKRAQAARAVDAKPPPLQGSSSDEAVPAPPPTLAAPEPARPPSPPAPVVLKRRLADAPPPVEKKPKLGGLVAYSSSSSSEGEGAS
ncbi:unnamed protein product [Pelagomonas calceolata]|uniref:Splicing factor YJU2 n=1 Tax=Pelagomonas calceolata TaxID=35677 RepID=A0A7S3ZR03_9STRA|nr:unnamed protein product [Pelagomonas calceolata]|mmetsp:Transcript_12012/g.35945  ORF Transcript_12012/g.35945 Transcript_12012/m.35945 type:complete len:278 (+) Transcript_12012:216-1049(+)